MFEPITLTIAGFADNQQARFECERRCLRSAGRGGRVMPDQFPPISKIGMGIVAVWVARALEWRSRGALVTPLHLRALCAFPGAQYGFGGNSMTGEQKVSCPSETR